MWLASLLANAVHRLKYRAGTGAKNETEGQKCELIVQSLNMFAQVSRPSRQLLAGENEHPRTPVVIVRRHVYIVFFFVPLCQVRDLCRDSV